MDPQHLTLFYLFCQEPVQNPRQKMAAGPRVIRDSVISVMEQTTLLRSYWKCLTLCVIHRQLGEVNGMHVCKYGNLMSQEGSE